VAELVKPHKAGRLVNQIKKLAEDIDPLPRVTRTPDPTDDFLLALSEAGKADYLVTGDKSGLLALRRHKGTQIMSARDFAALVA
jgi:predicted nucleic acid-binding protein